MMSLTLLRLRFTSLLPALALLSAVAPLACAPNVTTETDPQPEKTTGWSKRFGDAGPQVATGVTVDPKGHITVAGYFGDSVDLGKGPLPDQGKTDLFVASFDEDGHPLWSETFGGKEGDSLPARTFVGADAQGRLAVVAPRAGEIDFGLWALPPHTSAYDTVVAGLSPDGKPQWNRRFGADGRVTLTTSMAVSPAGDIVIAGNFSGAVDFGEGPLTNTEPTCSACANAIFVVALDVLGNTLWTRAFQSDLFPGGLVLPQVTFDAKGRVVLAGTVRGALDTQDGKEPIPGAGDDPTLFLLGFDDEGGTAWRASFPSSGDLTVSSVTAGADGRIGVTGMLIGSAKIGDDTLAAKGHYDLYAATFTASGNPLWASAFPGDGNQAAPGSTFDSAGDLVLVAPFTSPVDFGTGKLTGQPTSVLVARLDTSGDAESAEAIGASDGDATSHVARAVFTLDAADHLLLAGSFQGAVDFGSGPLASQGDDDAFLARTAF